MSGLGERPLNFTTEDVGEPGGSQVHRLLARRTLFTRLFVGTGPLLWGQRRCRNARRANERTILSQRWLVLRL